MKLVSLLPEEKASWHSEEQFRLLSMCSPIGIYLTDPEGRCLYHNPRFAEILGLPAGESVGADANLVIHPDDRGRVLAQWAAAAEAGREYDGQFRVLIPQGGARWVHSRAAPLFSAQREHLGHVGTLEDISQRIEAEQEQRRLTENLAQANHKLNDFAHMVSHDLKAPLRGIASLAGWLGEDFADKVGPVGLEQLDMLVSRVNRMQAMIDGLLQYACTGRQGEDKSLIHPNEVIADAIDQIAPPPQVVITVVHPLPKLLLEPTRFGQIIQNLLSNAVKFLDKPHGHIMVDCLAEGSMWKFRVSDNGPGIPAQHHERIFQIFQTLKPHNRVENTGIGLTIAKKIVEENGGTIGVESVVGEGSTFWFTLPCRE